MFRAVSSFSLDKIPSDWILKNYFDIDEGSVKIRFKSLFKKDDNTPSMFIFIQDNFMKYKCFATGKGGRVFDLMSEITGKSLRDLYFTIHDDYLTGKASFKINLEDKLTYTTKNVVKDINYRDWYKSDVNYWREYGVTIEILKFYKVIPIESVVISSVSNTGEEIETYSIKKSLMYGYHEGNKVLHKIYMPGQKMKFFTLYNTIQGYEQCNGKTGNLLITSSLKDIMSMRGIGIKNIDMIALPSETCLLSELELEIVRNNWSNVITLLDSDSTGIKMMQHMKEIYNFSYAYLPLAKDPSDSVKNFGKEKTLITLVPSLHNALGF